MKNSAAEFISVSQKVGAMVPFWTQGAGGNISEKIDSSKMRIKASGTRLDEVSHDKGISLVDLKLISEKLRGPFSEKQYDELLKKSSLVGRPSMETGFHAVLKKKWVLHFHSLAAILMAHEKTSTKTAPFKIQILTPKTPGLALSQQIMEAQASDAYILENHGLVLQGDTLDILKTWETFEKTFLKSYPKIEKLADKSPNEIIDALPDPIKGPLKVYFPDTAVFLKELKSLLKSLGNDQYEISHQEAKKILKGGSQKEKNLVEIWLATQLLYLACPDLKEVPDKIAEGISTLPTELYRRGISS